MTWIKANGVDREQTACDRRKAPRDDHRREAGKMEQRIAALEKHVEELKHWEEEVERAGAIRRMKLQAYAARHEHGPSW